MKKLKFILPVLLTFSLTSCIFNITKVNKPVSVSASVTEKTRLEKDYFDVDDISASVTYQDGTVKDFDFVNFEDNDLIARIYYPEQGPYSGRPKYFIPTDDFVMSSTGNWTVAVSTFDYNKNTFGDGELVSYKTFEVETVYITAESISLSESSLSMVEGESQQLVATVTPITSSSDVIWSSNDQEVATVSENGTVTAVGKGQCVIKAQIDELSAQCTITVNPTEEIFYTFTNKSFESSEGNWTYDRQGAGFDSVYGYGVQMMNATTITSPISYSKITYIYLDLYTSYSFMAFQSGKVSIYINGGLIYTSRLDRDGTNYSGYIPVSGGLNGDISIKIEPPTGSNGFIGYGGGSSYIFLKEVRVICNNNQIYATSIELAGSDSLPIGSSEKLVVNYNPVSCNQRDVIWSSTDESVLSVSSDGTITALEEGTAIISAQVATDGGYVSTTKEITVVSVPVESITLSKPAYDVYEGSIQKINVTINPSDASYKEVTYTSSNPEIATVDATGNIKGISMGDCTVTVASVRYPDIKATCNVHVGEALVITPTTMSYSSKEYTANNAYEIDSAPTIGDTNLLVIPVWFNDSTTYISESKREGVRSDIYKTFFGNALDTGWQSVKSYYETLSDGALNLNGTVSGWYECGYNSSTFAYTNGKYSTSNDPTCKIVTKAVDWYFSTYTSDSRDNYDSDGNGLIDAVILIYGTADYIQRQNSNADNLWAYTYWLQDSSKINTTNPGPNTFLWASYDFMYGTSDATQTRTGKSNKGSGDTKHCTLDAHTYIHEMGHVFGLDDYYDYSGQYSPAAGFSMQDTNVGSHDPYSALTFGWGKTYIPTESCTITLKPYQSDHEVILLTPSWNDKDSPFDEYLLVEFFTPTGLNELDCNYIYSSDSPLGPKAYGIRLWHVDARLVKVTSRVSSSNITNYPTTNCYYAMSNTYSTPFDNGSSSHLSLLGSSYYSYNILQLIRNNPLASYNPTDDLSEDDLFMSGDSFDMSTFGKQFVNTGKLNSKMNLGWSFTVDISGTGEDSLATITLTKSE